MLSFSLLYNTLTVKSPREIGGFLFVVISALHK
jgi:hypothetical protein